MTKTDQPMVALTSDGRYARALDPAVAGEVPYRLAPDGLTIVSHCGSSPLRLRRVDHACNESVVERDETFNYGMRRGRVIALSGDRPRFALATHLRQDRLDPDPVSVGDGRFFMRLPQWQGVLDEAPAIETLFRPGSTEHRINLPGATVRLRIAQAEDAGLVVLLEITAETATEGEIGFVFGGSHRITRTFSASYYRPDPQDGTNDVLAACEDGSQLVQAPGFGTAARLRVLPATIAEVRDQRWHFRWPVWLAAGATQRVAVIVAGGLVNELDSGILGQDPDALLSRTEQYYRELLERIDIVTPDPVLDAALRHAVVNLEYQYDHPCWLEGIHWWTSPFTDNYQISAAVCLGQHQRAADTLAAYNDPQVGPCPALNATKASARKDFMPVDDVDDARHGLPYWQLSLDHLLGASDDLPLLQRLWPAGLNSLERHLSSRQNADGSLSWPHHCNTFLYQADHLVLPGAATSPTAMLAAGCMAMARLGRRLGRDAEAARLEVMGGRLRRGLQGLWQADQGCFAGHRDPLGLVHLPHYYTDLVFPALYEAGVTDRQAWQCLAWLADRWFVAAPGPGLALMRVGDQKPRLFGNNNVMPTQMAEAAEGFARHGDHETATALLSAIALGAILYTEAPANFPERLSDHGKGEANYLFGNPTGSFIRAVVRGLFGAQLGEGGRNLHWQPALPEAWPQSRLQLPAFELSHQRSEHSTDGTVTWQFRVRHSEPRVLEFVRHLSPGAVVSARINDQPVSATTTPALRGIRFEATGPAALVHEVVIVHRPQTVVVQGPERVTVGEPVTWDMGEPIAAVDDPQRVLADVRIEGAHLFARVVGTPGPHRVFVELSKPRVVWPLALVVQAPVEPTRPVPPPGAGEPVSLAGLPVDNRIDCRSVWLHKSLSLLPGANWAPTIASAGVPFVLPAQPHPVRIHRGKCDPKTGVFTPSSLPSEVRIPVGHAVQRLHLLFVSEFEARLTGAVVVRLQLDFADGTTEPRSLLAGEQVGTLLIPDASRVRLVSGLVRGAVCDNPPDVRDLCAWHLVVEMASRQPLADLRIEMLSADADFNLLALTVERDAR